MITQDEIDHAAARLKEMGVPDDHNRWLRMTPAKFNDHEAAKARIAAQQRGDFTVTKMETTTPVRNGHDAVFKTPMQALTERLGSENRAAEALVKPYDVERGQREADYLRRWAKGKPIVRQSADSTFWAAGKWMTKLAASEVESLVAQDHATLTGNPREAGAVLLIKPKASAPAKPAAAAATKESTVKTTTTAAKKTPAAKPAPKKTTERKTTAKKADKKAAAANARTPVEGGRPDGLRTDSKQAVMLDMVLKPEGATEKVICKKLGWVKCRVTLKRVCDRVGAKLEAKKNVAGETVYFATMPAKK